jgi:hypothetical protein
MDEFRTAIMASREKETVKITVGAYIGGKGKVDTLYLHDFKNKTAIKSMLSNIMMNGMDEDHQHGIELPPWYVPINLQCYCPHRL